MTTTQPQPEPRGDTESPPEWRATLEQITDGLLDLLSDQPDLADRVGPLLKQAMRLRGQVEDLETKHRHDEYRIGQIAPHRRSYRPTVSSRHWDTLQADAEPLQLVPKQYRVDDHNLKEVTTSPQGETTLQINFDYYVRVAEALERLANARQVQSGKRAGVAARRIMTQTKRADVDEQVRGETVSLTHVYICMRFWMDADIIERPIRGQFRPVDAKQSFTTIAIETWKRLASETD